MRWPKYWSFSFSSVLLMNTQDWSPLGWTGWISLKSKGLSRVFSNTTVQSINSLALSFLHHHGICGFIPPFSCNKPNMVRVSQAFRQIPTSLEEKSDETLGLHLVVSFLKQMLVCLLFYLKIYTMFKGCFLFIITTKPWLHYPCCTNHPSA